MIEIRILLQQTMLGETENILRAIINDALGRYRSYDPQLVQIGSLGDFDSEVDRLRNALAASERIRLEDGLRHLNHQIEREKELQAIIATLIEELEKINK